MMYNVTVAAAAADVGNKGRAGVSTAFSSRVSSDRRATVNSLRLTIRHLCTEVHD